MAISGFSLHPLYCYRPLLSFSVGTIHHPVTMDQVIITMILTERGSRVTGSGGGLPMVGKEFGFRGIGDRAPESAELAWSLTHKLRS
jgi:hypothetical protein